MIWKLRFRKISFIRSFTTDCQTDREKGCSFATKRVLVDRWWLEKRKKGSKNRWKDIKETRLVWFESPVNKKTIIVTPLTLSRQKCAKERSSTATLLWKKKIDDKNEVSMRDNSDRSSYRTIRDILRRASVIARGASVACCCRQTIVSRSTSMASCAERSVGRSSERDKGSNRRKRSLLIRALKRTWTLTLRMNVCYRIRKLSPRSEGSLAGSVEAIGR